MTLRFLSPDFFIAMQRARQSGVIDCGSKIRYSFDRTRTNRFSVVTADARACEITAVFRDTPNVSPAISVFSILHPFRSSCAMFTDGSRLRKRGRRDGRLLNYNVVTTCVKRIAAVCKIIAIGVADLWH